VLEEALGRRTGKADVAAMANDATTVHSIAGAGTGSGLSLSEIDQTDQRLFIT